MKVGAYYRLGTKRQLSEGRLKIVQCDSRKSDKYSELFKNLLMTGSLKKY